MVAPIHDPCAKGPVGGRENRTGQGMGPQSQRRLTQQEGTHKLASSTTKRKSGQRNLFGGDAFEAVKDCVVCSSRARNLPVPHRSHHQLCPKNKKTKGITSAETLKQRKLDQERLAHFASPLTLAEKADWRHSTKAAGEAFFAPRRVVAANNPKPTSTSAASKRMEESVSHGR